MGSRGAEGRCHGNQFWDAIIGFVGYNCGCMIASGTLFDSRGGFSGSSYQHIDYVAMCCCGNVLLSNITFFDFCCFSCVM